MGISSLGARENRYSDPQELEAFLDRFFAENLDKHQVPGAGVALVQNGEILVQKGYGYANLEDGNPVNPAQTIFRAASVSKIFVVFSVLQLVEQGKLDLEGRVSDYLAGDPVSAIDLKGLQVKHLLTHTEGFPSRDLGSFTTSGDQVPPLQETLLRELKPPVLPAGQAISYGSMGSVLAAYLVEKVAGVPFTDYIVENIFAPLKMQNSSFEQELPAKLRGSLAATYTIASGEYLPTGYLYGTTPPSGGMSGTVEDLALFLTILTGDSHPHQEILDPLLLQEMKTTQFRGHPQLPGVTYGFFEHLEGGQQALIRDGSGFGVTTRILLIPAEKAGFVFMQNTRGDGLVEAFTAAYIKELFTGNPGMDADPPKESYRPQDYVGTYRTVQYHRNLMKPTAYFSGMVLHVDALEDGHLILKVTGPGDIYGWGGFEHQAILTPISDGLFSRNDREGYLALVPGEKGEMFLLSGSGYHSAYQRIGFWEYPLFHLVVSAFFLFFFLTIGMACGISFRKMRQEKRFTGKGDQLLTAGCATICLGHFSYPLGVFYLAFLMEKEGFPAIAFGISPPLALWLYLPVVLTGAALITGLLWLGEWRSKKASSRLLVITGMALLLSAAYIPYLVYWHMLPWLAV